MRYRVLGPLVVEDEAGTRRDIRRGRPRTLVHLLVVHRRVAVPLETVADRLWGDDQPANVPNAVHQLVSYLRRSLGSSKDDLVTSAAGYHLDVGDDDVDAYRFLRLLQLAGAELERSADGGDARRALATAEEAAALWRGEPFAESADQGWIAGDVARLKEAYLAVQETRLDAMLALGRHREVVLEAQSLASAYPFREQFHALTALALYRSERQSEALDGLRAVRELLSRELGLDPGARLRELEQAILRQEPALAWSPPAERIDAAATGDQGREAAGTHGSADADETRPALPPSVLPPVPGRLFGRADDLARLRGDLSEPGATVVLTGMPGVGKTAIAAQLAHDAAASGDAVWWVDLRSVEAAAFVVAAVVQQTCAMKQQGDPAGRLADAFRGAEGVVVLDGCEQVPDGTRSAIDVLRAAAPRMRVVVTSRRALDDLPGALRRRVAPLAVSGDQAERSGDPAGSPAVELFVERARRVRADFNLTPANRDAVVAAVAAVEGLPLGIEVAAAQVDVMSVADVAAELAVPPAGIPDHPAAEGMLHPTLGVALDVTTRLLAPDERAAFTAWAIFGGEFTAEDAAAVHGTDVATARRLLVALVRQSLLQHDGTSTYRMLRPVHAYARSRLTGAAPRELWQRHVAHVTAVVSAAARELRTTTDALTRLRRYEADARSALARSLADGDLDPACEIATAYTWYWAINGHPDEGLRWLRDVERVVADKEQAGSPVTPVRRGTLLRCIGLLANPLGDVVGARDACRAALALLEVAGDELGVVDTLLTLGISEWALGDLAAAASAHDEVLARTAGTDEPFRVLTATVLRARTALDAGAGDAQQRIEAAVELAQQQGEKQLLSIALALLSRWQLEAGHVGEAGLAAEQALSEARSIGYREGEMGALNLLGRTMLEAGEVEPAIDVLTRALRLASDARHPAATCESLESLALASATVGGHERAYLLTRAAERERVRRGLAAVDAGHRGVERASRAAAAVLGPEAASLVEARVALRRFDELVGEVLAGLPAEGQYGGAIPAPPSTTSS